MLCDICQKINYDDLVQEPVDWVYHGFQHHKNFFELETCLNCDFCKAICEAVKNDPSLQTDDRKWQEDSICLRCFPSSTGDGDERDKSNLLVYSSSGQGAETKQTTLAFFGLYIDKTRDELETGRVDTTRLESSLITARNINKMSNDDDCFIMARSWLDQCTRNKPHGLDTVGSTQEKVESFRPSRTIDVGPPEGTVTPRLVCHKDQISSNEPMQWITLSHTWGTGKSRPISTTMSTLAKHQKSIPVFSMPKTFQDAILLTRRLGFRHLWIDSLCIIQDSPEDWAAEALQMGKIYQHGILNVAADDSPNCDGGLFHVRPFANMDILLPLRSENHGLETYMYARAGLYDRYRPYILGSESTLTSRGWVLQEALLSPRTLHYTQQQIYWECEHVTLCEGNMDPLVTRDISRGIVGHYWVSHKLVLPHSIIEGGENNTNEKDVIFRSWLQLIKNYTARHLTVQTDIFASLAGIASIFQESLSERYLAGIFEGDLIKGLLWRVVDSKTAVKRVMSGVPSWSWASIIGAAEFEISTNSSLSVPQAVGGLGASIIDARVFTGDTKNKNLTGFTGGELTIEGLILEGTDRLSYLRTDFKSSGGTAKFEQTRQIMGYLDTKAVEETIVTKELVLLHLGAWEWWFHGGATWNARFYRRFSGLLLKPVNASEGVYERVGMISLTFWFEDVIEGCVFESEDEKFLEHHDWKRRAIKII